MLRQPFAAPARRWAAGVVVGAALLAGSACSFGTAHTCTMSNETVSGSFSNHVYAYALACTAVNGVQVGGTVNASYDVSTGIAQEKLVLPQGQVTAEWKCVRDPWTRPAGDQFECSQLWRKANLNIENKELLNDLTNRKFPRPYSEYGLTDAHRQVLASRLRAAQSGSNRIAQKPVGQGGGNKIAKQPVGQTVDRSSQTYVKWVQTALNQVDNAQIPVDGDYGPVTANAVRQFQTRKNLDVDGVVGAVTEQALVAAGAPKPPGARRTGQAQVK